MLAENLRSEPSVDAEGPAAVQLELEALKSEPGDEELTRIGDLCPDCGHATLVYEEGCHKCYSCGFSEC